MKGLIKKDILFLRGYMKSFALVLVVFIVFSFYNDHFSVAFFLPFIAVMMSIASFSYDDYNKWDAYAISLPVSKKQIVASKYLFTGFVIVIGSILGIAISLSVSAFKGTPIVVQEFMMQVLGGMIGIALVIAIIYPFLFKFGVEKGRILFFVFLFGGSLLIGSLAAYLKSQHIQLAPNLFDQIKPLLSYLTGIIMLLLLAISYLISSRIYAKKEF